MFPGGLFGCLGATLASSRSLVAGHIERRAGLTAQHIQGFDPIMPSFGRQLSEEQVVALIAYTGRPPLLASPCLPE